jgi:hypothetical protein
MASFVMNKQGKINQDKNVMVAPVCANENIEQPIIDMN